MRYGMVIDLRRCIGCNACTIACRQQNATGPNIFWARVLIYEIGRYPNARLSYQPMLCFHCDEPACKEVCPTGATQKLPNGIVTIDSNKCIGCRACMVACPYGARFFNSKKFGPYFAGKGFTPYEESQPRERRAGRVGKCDFCFDRIQSGEEPACVVTCPGKARIFGDLDDPKSNVSKLIVERAGFQLCPELGTDPSVYYLPA
jgi:Fe-S-cluster-containing dehydrogenase component